MPPIGVMLNNVEPDRLRAFERVRALGFDLVHANAVPEAMLAGPARAAYVTAARTSGLTIATLFVGFDGQDYTNRATIATTVGLAPPALRPHRLVVARRYSDLALELGVPSLSMHLGFLPDEQAPIVTALRELLDLCAGRGQTIHLETGQESAAELLDLIRRIDRPNLFVNFDPGNFILYGTDTPLPALELLYPLIRGVHCKDGLPPLTPDALGRETRLGEGAVDFPTLLRRLLQRGYAGLLVIEREHGANVVDEVLAARRYLERLLGET